ncbi:unnamed protein product, partial [Oikopleura dioica]
TSTSERTVIIRRKASISGVLIVFVYLISWLPNRLTSSLLMIQQYEIAKIPDNVMKPLMFVHKLNSCWLILAVAINPFLYALHGQNIRQGVIKSMKKSPITAMITEATTRGRIATRAFRFSNIAGDSTKLKKSSLDEKTSPLTSKINCRSASIPVN